MSVSQDVLPAFTGMPIKANVKIKRGALKSMARGMIVFTCYLPSSELRLRLFMQHKILLKIK